MNSDRLNRWLTLGANLGVLVGIILILAELNQNSDLMRAQMTQARGDNVIETYRELMHSDYWAEIRAKRRAAASVQEWVDSLTPTEYERAWYRQLVDFHDLRTQFFQHQAGYLDQRIWENSSKEQARRLLVNLPYFPITSIKTDKEFREFLNNIAREFGIQELPEYE